MDNQQNRTTTIAVVTGIVTLLLGLCLGAFAGGIGGYLVGRQAGERAYQPYQLNFPTPQMPLMPRLTPSPEQPGPGFQVPQGPNAPDVSGAWVRQVIEGSPAAAADIRPGDMITRVDNTPVDATHQLADVLQQYKPGNQITLTIWRAGQTNTVKVTLGSQTSNKDLPYLGIRFTQFTPQTPNPGD